MKRVLCISNLMTDITVKVTDEELARLGLQKGMAAAKPGARYALPDPVITQGGGAANTAVGLAWLGIPSGLFGTLGTDELGRLYQNDLAGHRLRSYAAVEQGQSGVAYTFIAPDGERTFAYDLGVAPKFRTTKLMQLLPQFDVLYTTGYELTANPHHIIPFLETAKARGLVTAFDLASAAAIKEHEFLFRMAMNYVDVAFANEDEAVALEGSVDAALYWLTEKCQTAAVKLGEQGSKVSSGGNTYGICRYDAKGFRNTNGAGDAYAAGFLAGYCEGKTPDGCGNLGSEFAAKVCEQDGARMPARP
jgi:sugar/nucleoside kinase (ribokinase family)